VRPLPPALPVLVPDVVGATWEATTSAISTAGLVVGTVTQQASSTVARGSVINQNPLAGVPVERGSAVNLVVSSGEVRGNGGGGALDGSVLTLLAGFVFSRSAARRR